MQLDTSPSSRDQSVYLSPSLGEAQLGRKENEDISEHENNFDNLLYRSARVERVVAAHCGEPFTSVFFGGFFGGRPRSARGDNRHPRRGAPAQPPQNPGDPPPPPPHREQPAPSSH